jgi:hypothetical protein
MLHAEFRGERTWASEFPDELANINTCEDGLTHYPRCPECGDRVSHNSESRDCRAAHFQHCPSAGGGGGGGGGGAGCSGATVGESLEHDAMKSIAASAVGFALSRIGIAETRLEEPLAAPHSNANGRVADCLLMFEQSDEQLGEGLIIEIQYGNKSKDKHAVTADYLKLDRDYSVLWLWPKDFNTRADVPRDWNCKVVQEQQVRDKVRSQIWPPGNPEAIWDNREETSGYTSPEVPVVGLSAYFTLCEVESEAEFYLRKIVREATTDLPNPKIAGTAVDGLARQIKEEYVWEELFTATTHEQYIREVRDELGLPEAQVPATISIPKLIIQRQCPGCGAEHDIRKRAPGETMRAKTCVQCGEWFTVFDFNKWQKKHGQAAAALWDRVTADV